VVNFTLIINFMKQFTSIFCLFVLISSVGFSQNTDASSEINAYLESNNSLDQYRYAYDQLLLMLESRYPQKETNKEGWAYLRDHKEKSIQEMKASLVPVYEKHFELDEISQMTSFYKSSAGKQLVTDRSKMNEAQKEALNTFYNSVLGQKIIEKQGVLTQEIGKISEDWSHDLYQIAVSLLKD